MQPTPAEAVELAQLLAGRVDVLRIDRERRHRYAAIDWPDVLPDCPYAVHLTDERGDFHTLALDLDAGKGGDPRRDADALEGALAEVGLRTVRSASGTGVHLLATLTEGVDAAIVAAVARALRAIAPSLDPTPLHNPSTGAIRPPGSPHRAGGRSTLTTPIDVALATLRARNDPALLGRLLLRSTGAIPARSRRPAPEPRALPPTYLSLQRHGDPEAPDRSSVAARICLAYVNAGLTEADFLAAARDTRNAGLDHLRRTRSGDGFRSRSARDISAACRRMWAGRVRYALHNPSRAPGAAAAEHTIRDVLAAVQVDPRRWGGQAGPADAAVLLALCQLVREIGRPTVSPGVRLLAERSGVTRSTAARALQRLVLDGWLELEQESVGVHAAEYRLQVPGHLGQQGAGLVSQPRQDDGELERLCSVLSHDACTSAGLGRYAGALLARLGSGAASARQLAERTGFALRTVQRHLTRLSGLGLVLPNPRGWQSADRALLDAVAAALNARGTVARRVDMHADERLTWRWLHADQLARRGWTHERGLYLAGRHTLVGRGLPTPSLAFPRSGGRADWRTGLALVREGAGPCEESVERVLAVDAR